MSPSSRPTRANVSSARSRCSSVCAAVTIVRSRARSSATVGKTTLVAKTPSWNRRSENAIAARLSPTMTGVMGVSETARVEAQATELRLEPLRVRPQALVELRLLVHHLERLAACGDHGGRVRRREQERPRPLHEDVAQAWLPAT